MGIAQLAAAPVAVTLGAKTYKVGPLTHLQIGMLQRYLDDRCQSPYDLARAEADRLEVPAAERGEWLRDARAASKGWAPPQVLCDARWLPALADHAEGVIYLLYVALERYQPGVTMEDAEAAAGAIDAARLWEVVRVLIDHDPADEGDPDPKAR